MVIVEIWILDNRLFAFRDDENSVFYKNILRKRENKVHNREELMKKIL